MDMQFPPVGDELTLEPELVMPAVQGPAPEDAPYDVDAERQLMTQELAGSREIDSIVSQISAYEVHSVITFGNAAASEISKVSDQVLRSVNLAQINQSGNLLETLGKIMDKFDPGEIARPEPRGILGRLRGNTQQALDRTLQKYRTMGDEIDRVYVQLKAYEHEITEASKQLEALYNANIGYYKQLMKYILAGEQGIREIGAHIRDLRAEYERHPDNLLALDINSVEQVQVALEQRVMDLRLAEQVAMQSLPMIRMMQMSNLQLVRKINSAFIVTLPVFKQALTQAILLKRQRIQADAMRALDARTNEMLRKNAANMAEGAKLTAQLSNTGPVQTQTLEQTWRTILQGIEETQVIQENARRSREDDSRRLEQLKTQYEQHTASSAG